MTQLILVRDGKNFCTKTSNQRRNGREETTESLGVYKHVHMILLKKKLKNLIETDILKLESVLFVLGIENEYILRMCFIYTHSISSLTSLLKMLSILKNIDINA